MSYPKKVSNNQWIIEVQENSKSKELFIEFPQECIDQVGWDAGDTILWDELPDGSWTLKKVDSPK